MVWTKNTQLINEIKLAYEKNLPKPNKIQVVDFFCGCGGMSYGFKNTRLSHLAFEIIAGIDIDDVALQTYEHMIGAPGIHGDIAELSTQTDLLKNTLVEKGLKLEQPFLFIGCAPCQGFSAHRKKDDVDDVRNSLPVSFANICAEFRPYYFVIENVPEVFTGRFKKYMDEALNIFEKNGYKISKDVQDVSLFGVPQKRRRAIIIGTLSTTPVKIPEPIFTKDNVLSVRHAISHLDALKDGQECVYDPWHKAPKHTSRILKLVRKIPLDGGDRRHLPIEDQLDCHKRLEKSDITGFTDVYGRLFWDKPSVSITAKSSTPSCGRFLHPEQHRNITVREAALLQGFPPSFEFKGPFVHQYRQIGEAVPPLYSRFLAWTILSHNCPANPPEFLNYAVPKTVEDKKGLTNRKLIAIEAFCGAGGLSLGLLQAGIDIKLGFDNDRYALETYTKNLGSHGELLDASIVSSKELLKLSKLRGELDIFAGGPPCQGFSQQRRGSNVDSRNNLVTAYSNLAIDLNPKAIILENVTYLDSPRGRDILAQVISTWERNGYKVFKHELNSADFGVSQLRSRIIVVAIKEEYSYYYNGPEPTNPNRWLTVGEVFSQLPDPTSDEQETQKLFNHTVSKEGELNRRRIAFVGMGEGRLAIPQYLQLPCHKEYDGHLDVYGRLDWFCQARTITGGFDSFTRGEYAHPFQHRSITHREAARIQGFPDWFIFYGNKAAVRHQIGNAVPPPLGKVIGEGIKDAILKADKQDKQGVV